ncbi:thiamine pyrophosphate-binding protein [Acidobacteria bacterium AH-259-O06]|nr:thiamine pyrophosphate-binding protein [Acidobacteria bacterium AH-259-O06]
MKELMEQFLGNRISRRSFVHTLAGLGISAAGIESIVRESEAVVKGNHFAARRVTGTGGELMVAQMKAAGVRFLFTNPGSFEVGFFDAFLDQPGMNLIMGLHEGIVISLADGYHKVSGEPAFVNVHVIAGTAQAAGQLYNASRDGSALVVTAGLLDNEVYSDDIRLGPRPGFDQKEVNRQFTKISWEAHDAAGIPVMLRRAFKVASTAPGGPVYLAIPNYALEKRGVTADIYDRRHFMIPSNIPPDQDQIMRVAELLLESRSPLLFLGDEVTKYHAQPEALELAELLAIPVSEDGLTAYHSFPRRHGLFTGRFYSKGRDLILNFGASDLGVGRGRVPNSPLYGEDTTVVRAGLNTAGIGRNNPFDLALVASVKQTLGALIEAVKSMATKERLAKIADGRPELKVRRFEIDKAHVGLSPVHPDELGWALEEELDKDAILVSENLTGSNQFYSTGFRENEKMWVSNSGAGLGWGVGAAAGAKLAAPERQVVCSIGDGSVMYSASGFWTQARYEIPVLTVVCNNRNYQTVRRAYFRYNRKMKASNRFCGMYLGDPDIDFVKLAQSQGINGIRVESSLDLRPALRRGIAATREGRPFLIDVIVRRTGGGADSTWYQAYSAAKTRTRKV